MSRDSICTLINILKIQNSKILVLLLQKFLCLVTFYRSDRVTPVIRVQPGGVGWHFLYLAKANWLPGELTQEWR